MSLQNGGWDMLTEVTRSIHEVCEGELIQTEQTEKLAMTEAIYYDIIYKKTASLLGACAAVGAISVGAPADRVAALRQFGDHLGIAFQIKDDILDYSPMEVTGKPAGGDMRERKITLPLLRLLDQSAPERRRKLVAKLSDVRNSPKNVDYLCKAVLCAAVHDRIPESGAGLPGRLSGVRRTSFAAFVRRFRSFAR